MRLTLFVDAIYFFRHPNLTTFLPNGQSGQIEVSERFFEKISRNMTDTEKMMLTNIIGNIADNIVFEVSKIGPVDPEIWAKKVVKITETRIS